MGQEDEEQAELIATIQHDHAKMKQWYNTAPESKSALHSKYGMSYPSFWREVVSWNGWKESRKLFLKSMELKEKKERERKNNGGNAGNAANGVSGTNTGTGSETGRRKRRSRWGNATNDTTNTNTNTNNDSPPKRKSRWGDRGRSEAPKPLSTNSASVLDILPGLPTNLNSEQSQKLKGLQKLLREANQKLENLEVEAERVDALPNGHPDRSPSPPPVYGVDGKRKNTRAIRWKERYTNQRQDTLEQILSLTTSNSQATSSIAPSLFKRKRTRKIHIPVEKHPTYNFIGLIIGPRGKTQKDMENKTGCKIAIRGKGSVKEGARGRRDGKLMEGDDEPLHVVITGDNQANVDAAADMIDQMLVVIDDDKNVHKQQQLRELALLNGTLKDDEYCPICGEKGHRAFECPKRFSMNKNTISVKCAICGDTSHPTRDCKLKPKDGTFLPAAENEEKAEKELDSDYLAFMNELDGKPAGDTDNTTTKTVSSVAADRKELESLVQTIEKTVGGVTVRAPPSKINSTNNDAVAPKPTPMPTVAVTGGNSLITTISSRIVKSAPDTAEATTPLITEVKAAMPDTGTTNAPTTSVLAASAGTTTAPLPPLPPPMTTMAPRTTVPPPNITGMTTALPPPPSSVPPPPPNSHYGHQPQHQPTNAYYPPQYAQQYQQPHSNAYSGYQGNVGNQPYHAQQQQQQYQQQQQPGGISGWDYRNYYGSGHTGGDADGAGGFNWWESSS